MPRAPSPCWRATNAETGACAPVCRDWLPGTDDGKPKRDTAMHSLPTQDQVDCLIGDGIDAGLLPIAGPSPIRKIATVQVEAEKPKMPVPQPKRHSRPVPSTPRRIAAPSPAVRSSSAPFPVPVLVLVLVVVLIGLLALLSK